MTPLPKILPIRVCSGNKSSIPYGFLKDIYVEKMLKAFFNAFENTGYAVLSRKNGICLWKDKTENYGDWQEKDDEQIKAMLREQAKNPELRAITWIYWNHRPLTQDKWVRMLRDAGFRVIECRKLAEIQDILARSSASSLSDIIAKIEQFGTMVGSSKIEDGI